MGPLQLCLIALKHVADHGTTLSTEYKSSKTYTSVSPFRPFCPASVYHPIASHIRLPAVPGTFHAKSQYGIPSSPLHSA